MADPTETNERNKGSEGEEIKRKVKTKAQFKKMAREKGKNKSPKVEVQLPLLGLKGWESLYLKKEKNHCRKGDAQSLIPVILKLKKDRRWLQGSIAKRHESLKLELSGAWEPPVSQSIA